MILCLISPATTAERETTPYSSKKLCRQLLTVCKLTQPRFSGNRENLLKQVCFPQSTECLRNGKKLSHHVTPSLNHSKCSHFSSQMPLEVLDFLTNEAQGLSAWTSELLDLSFAGADYLWKTLHHHVLKLAFQYACTEVFICASTCVLPCPFSPRQFHLFKALRYQTVLRTCAFL